MTEAERKMMQLVGAKPEEFEPKTTERIVHISREDFSLLDATESSTVYYIAEENGTVTMIKGDNR